jgi:hypothetical protein
MRRPAEQRPAAGGEPYVFFRQLTLGRLACALHEAEEVVPQQTAIKLADEEQP